MLTTQEPNRKADRGESLTAQEYLVTAAGIEARIMRRVAPRIGDPLAPRDSGALPTGGAMPVMGEWVVHMDASTAFSLTWDSSDHRQPCQHYIVTQASFPFVEGAEPGHEDGEDAALERARRYAVDVGHAVATLRPALEGLVQRVGDEIAAAVQEHRAVPMKFH